VVIDQGGASGVKPGRLVVQPHQRLNLFLIKGGELRLEPVDLGLSGLGAIIALLGFRRLADLADIDRKTTLDDLARRSERSLIVRPAAQLAGQTRREQILPGPPSLQRLGPRADRDGKGVKSVRPGENLQPRRHLDPRTDVLGLSAAPHTVTRRPRRRSHSTHQTFHRARHRHVRRRPASHNKESKEISYRSGQEKLT
jgi:hypothetical protein